MQFKIENGAMVEVPCYETHSRGKNWFATIHPDPKAPNGLGRMFHDKANGKYYYMTSKVNIGDAVEFGADYYTGGGNPSRNRTYGVVVGLSEDCIEIDDTGTAAKAIKAAEEFKKSQTSESERKKRIESEIKALETRISELKDELTSL